MIWSSWCIILKSHVNSVAREWTCVMEGGGGSKKWCTIWCGWNQTIFPWTFMPPPIMNNGPLKNTNEKYIIFIKEPHVFINCKESKDVFCSLSWLSRCHLFAFKILIYKMSTCFTIMWMWLLAIYWNFSKYNMLVDHSSII